MPKANITMFKRAHANASATRNNPGTSSPPPMGADVYQRNGIATRPASINAARPPTRHVRRSNNNAFNPRSGPLPPLRSTSAGQRPNAMSPRTRATSAPSRVDGSGNAAPSRSAYTPRPPPRPTNPPNQHSTATTSPHQESQQQRLTFQFQPGPLGVHVQQSRHDGTCIVTAKTIASTPLQVGDVIHSLNGTVMVDVKGGAHGWVHLIAESANSTRTVTVVVVRRSRTAGEEGLSAESPLVTSPPTNSNTPPNNAPSSRRFLRSMKNAFSWQASNGRRNSRGKNSAAAITLRVYIQGPMQPGRNIRILCPDKSIMPAVVPPRTHWVNDTNTYTIGQFFRVEFDPSAPGGASLTTIGMENAPACTCVPELGVFDTTCPVHGACQSIQCHHTTRNHSNDISNHNASEQEMISVAQEEGHQASTTPAQQLSVTLQDLGWECKACSLINEFQTDKCEVCGVGRYGAREGA